MSLLVLNEIARTALAAVPDASDILLSPERPPQALAHGELAPTPLPAGASPEGGVLTPFHTETMGDWLMGNSRRLRNDLERTGACDLAHELQSGVRFRVNIFRRRGSLSIVMRRLPAGVPTCKELFLPQAVRDMAKVRDGLVLAAGATGTGKTTTLAALVDAVNASRAVHIVTLEDPVEFSHASKTATVSQRELGVDFCDFASGLRAALRQAPRVILVGEMRDRETVDAALSACETGHLVFGTVHASDCGQTINRILGMFDTADERFLRNRLAAGLAGCVAQRLPKRIGGGRTAAFEVMLPTLRVRDLILNGETEDKTFYDVIHQGGAGGMQTFDQHLAQLFGKGLVDEETALSFATDRALLARNLDAVKSAGGGGAARAPNLELDWDYAPDES